MGKKIRNGTSGTMLLALVSLCALLFALRFSAEAQQPARIAKIGYLLESSSSATANLDKAFLRGMQELGYIEGKNFLIEARWSKGPNHRFAPLVAELVRLNVDVIVTGSTAMVLAVQQVTKTIPIVAAHMSESLEAGLVTSHARPGGNVTGLRSLNAELNGKRFELLTEAFPKVSKVAVLAPGDGKRVAALFKSAAASLGVEFHPVLTRYPEPDFNKLSLIIGENRANALTVMSSLRHWDYIEDIVDLAAKSRLPAIYPQREFVEAGGLMSYGPPWEAFYHRAAYYVDRILKGAKPADLPVEQPTKIEFVINLQAARQIAATIPPAVLMNADRVIK
jgi:putative tryptophan/tyrosine transport system substrate-binding protein